MTLDLDLWTFNFKLVSAHDFHWKKLNQFVEIFMSTSWPAVHRLSQRYWSIPSEVGDFSWFSGDNGFICHQAGMA